jgi:hypothetical protein
LTRFPVGCDPSRGTLARVFNWGGCS